VIVVEDLHVAGMLRNRRLARHIAGAAWAEIRRQLSYKAEWAGCGWSWQTAGSPPARSVRDAAR
jgi:IS605 OrfB family transposase